MDEYANTMPSDPTQRRNVELKARIGSLDAARTVCRQFARFAANERQTDTYFACSRGRLKLRERAPEPAQLVAYSRADAATPRASDYWLVPAPDPTALKAALASTLGVLVVVEKEREVFLHRNVRIHLDRVAGLGEFIEFEAVLSSGDDETAAAALVAELAERLQIDPCANVDGSYSDLLLVEHRAGR